MFVTVYRTSKFALHNFWRNLWLSVITVFILTLTVFTGSIVGMLNVLGQQAITAIQGKINIDIYFKPAADEQEVLAAKVWLESQPQVASVRYTSPDDAMQNFKEYHVNDENIQQVINEIDSNPLPASLTIQAKQLADYASIIQLFESSDYNDLAQDKTFSNHQLMIDQLSDITRRIAQAGIGVSLVLVFISAMMMFNTIRIAIFTHREEVGIMKLVGATNWFIRGPFLFEALLYGLVASVLALGLLWLTVAVTSPYVNAFFSGYNFNLTVFFNQYVGLIFLLQLAAGLVLAVGSSMISIGRYLKV